MNVNVEKIAGSKAEIKVEISSEEFKEYYEEALEQILETADVKGFRKGKVPRSIYLSRFGDGQVYQDALDNALNKSYAQAIREENLRVLADPEIDIDFEKFQAEKSLAYTAVVTIYPEVELGQYFGVEVQKDSAEVKDEDIENSIEIALKNKADLELVEEGTLENGQTAVFDFEGFMNDVAFEGGKADNYSLEIGSGQFIPGFEEQMLGMKPEEEKYIDVTFPEDYHAEDLKGQKAKFRVKLHEIKKRVSPVLDDAFVAALAIEDVKTVEEYREYTKEKLAAEKQEASDNKFEYDLLTKICEAAKVEIPEVLIEQRKESILQQEERRAQTYNIQFEQLLAYQGMTLEQFKEQIGEPARLDVLKELVLNKISEVEKLTLEEEDFQKGYEKFAALYNLPLENIEKQFPRERIAYHFLLEKTIAILKEKAIIK